MEEDNLIELIEESQKITSALATRAYELTPLQVAWIVGKVKHAYKLKLGQFAEEAFKAEQRANKLAAEWGLAQITIAELRNVLCEPPTLPEMPAPVARHEVFGDLFDRIKMHQYAISYSDLCLARCAKEKTDKYIWNEGDDEHS